MLSFVTPAMAQSSSPQTPDSTSPIQLIPRNAEQRREAAERISLIVNVTDASGKPAAGLKASDFTVLDQRKPQNIVQFREVDGKNFTADVQVVIVLDGINGSSLRRVRKQLDPWLSRSKGPLLYPTSMALATESGVIETGASTDRAALSAGLTRITRNVSVGMDCEASTNSDITPGIRQMFDYGSRMNCLWEQSEHSINALRALIGLRQQTRKRTIVIWTGPGWSLPLELPANYYDVLANLTTNIREAQVTLDAVSWTTFNQTRYYRQPIMSVTAIAPTPNRVAEKEMALPHLAEESGGRALTKVKDFSSVLASLIDGADHFYVVSFDSTPSAAPDEYRTLEITVDQPQLVVHAAKAYYAEP